MGEQGLFGVKLEVVDGSLCAVLTGDHYEGDGKDKALEAFEETSRSTLASDSSPVYLAEDTVVRVAVQMMRRMIRDEAVDCHEGENGKPCGQCKTCEAAKREAFTHVVIGNLVVPGSDLHTRLDNVVRSTIGLGWVDSPWWPPFTDEEVEEVFEELGVNTRKENK